MIFDAYWLAAFFGMFDEVRRPMGEQLLFQRHRSCRGIFQRLYIAQSDFTMDDGNYCFIFLFR